MAFRPDWKRQPTPAWQHSHESNLQEQDENIASIYDDTSIAVSGIDQNSTKKRQRVPSDSTCLSCKRQKLGWNITPVSIDVCMCEREHFALEEDLELDIGLETFGLCTTQDNDNKENEIEYKFENPEGSFSRGYSMMEEGNISKSEQSMAPKAISDISDPSSKPEGDGVQPPVLEAEMKSTPKMTAGQAFFSPSRLKLYDEKFGKKTVDTKSKNESIRAEIHENDTRWQAADRMKRNTDPWNLPYRRKKVADIPDPRYYNYAYSVEEILDAEDPDDRHSMMMHNMHLPGYGDGNDLAVPEKPYRRKTSNWYDLKLEES